MTAYFPVFYSDQFERHDTGVGHPENAGRLRAIVDYLRSCGECESDETDWARQIQWIAPTDRNVLDSVDRVHDAAYLMRLEQLAKAGGGALDMDTVVCDRSYEIALKAVAAWLDGVDWVQAHQRPGFALVRPPGHHAERDRGMGFCLLSNAAIAAHYAVDQLGLSRVGILDWDVHHGNGTQALISDRAEMVYCSLHQSPAYPGTGQRGECGHHQNVLNLPLPPGAVLADYQAVWEESVVPFLTATRPQLLLVSAGYDANRADPLAQMSLVPEDYAWLTRACLAITPATLFGLEGGYDYPTLAESVAATIQSAYQRCY